MSPSLSETSGTPERDAARHERDLEQRAEDHARVQAVDDLRAIIKRNHESLAYAAPEMQPVFWERMAEELEDLVRDLLAGRD